MLELVEQTEFNVNIYHWACFLLLVALPREREFLGIVFCEISYEFLGFAVIRNEEV